VPDDEASRLFQAFVAQDPASAIQVVERVRSGGVAQADLFDTLYVPAVSFRAARVVAACTCRGDHISPDRVVDTRKRGGGVRVQTFRAERIALPRDADVRTGVHPAAL